MSANGEQNQQIQLGRLAFRHADNVSIDKLKALCSKIARVNDANRPQKSKCTTFVQFEDHESAIRVKNYIEENMPEYIENVIFATHKHGRNVNDRNRNSAPRISDDKVTRSDTASSNFRMRNEGASTSLKSAEFKNSDPGLGFVIVNCTFKLCGKSAMMACATCMSPYCSQSCQGRDWPTHKLECIPMPKLVPLPKLSINESFNSTFTSFDTSLSISSGYNNTRQQRSPDNQRGKMQNSTQNSSLQNRMLNQNGFETQERHSKNVKSSEKEDPKPAITPEPKNASSVLGSRRKRSEEVIRKKEMTSYNFPKNKSIVSITSVFAMSPNFVYIRTLETKLSDEYKENLKKISALANIENFLQNCPTIGDIVLAKFSDIYFRAKVVGVDLPNHVEVFFIDYGNREKVAWKELKEISNFDLKYAKNQIHSVLLKGITADEKYKRETYDFLDTLLEHEFEMVIDDESSLNSVKSVELKNPRDPFNTVNKQVMEMVENLKTKELQKNVPVSVAKKIEETSVVPAENKHYFLDEFNIPQLPAGKKVNIVILDMSLLKENMVSCMEEKFLVALSEIQSKCVDFGAADTMPYKPKENELCLVLTDDWMRGFYIPDKDNEDYFFLCDFGIFETVEAKNIRRIPKELAELPIYTAGETAVTGPDGEEPSAQLIDQLRADKHGKLSVEVFYKEDLCCIKLGR